MTQYYVVTGEDDLLHFGVKGQKWGVRRYQNPDGTLTDAGKKKYSKQIAAKDAELKRISSAKSSEKKHV